MFSEMDRALDNPVRIPYDHNKQTRIGEKNLCFRSGKKEYEVIS